MPRGQVYYEVMKLLNPRRRRSNRGNHRLLRVVVEQELGDVLESLEGGRCPFCGRSFRSYMWARAHVARSRCSFALKSRIEDTLKLYRRINSCIRRVNGLYQLRVGDYRTPYFRTKGLLVRYIAETGLITKLKSSF